MSCITYLILCLNGTSGLIGIDIVPQLWREFQVIKLFSSSQCYASFTYFSQKEGPYQLFISRCFLAAETLNSNPWNWTHPFPLDSDSHPELKRAPFSGSNLDATEISWDELLVRFQPKVEEFCRNNWSWEISAIQGQKGAIFWYRMHQSPVPHPDWSSNCKANQHLNTAHLYHTIIMNKQSCKSKDIVSS